MQPSLHGVHTCWLVSPFITHYVTAPNPCDDADCPSLCVVTPAGPYCICPDGGFNDEGVCDPGKPLHIVLYRDKYLTHATKIVVSVF